MNIKILTATALAAVLGLTSCSKDAKLADDLAGTWKSAPTAMMPDDDDHQRIRRDAVHTHFHF